MKNKKERDDDDVGTGSWWIFFTIKTKYNGKWRMGNEA